MIFKERRKFVVGNKEGHFASVDHQQLLIHQS